jgi:hypothetical protein
LVAPLSHLAGDLTKRIHALDKAIERDGRDTLKAAAQAAKEAQLETMTGDAGGDLRLSRVRSGRGAKIGASYSVRQTGDKFTAEVKATGPLPLLANPIPAHAMPKKGRRRKVLAIPGVGVRASAQHPGTKGKDTWNRGREKAEPRVTKVIQGRTDKSVRRAFQTGG